MSVVTVPSTAIPQTKARLGVGEESEKFRMRRMRIRQMEHEQVLEDMAALRMIQQLHDSSIFPASSVKTEFSDLDGMSWHGSRRRGPSLLEQWKQSRTTTAHLLPKSTSLTLPLTASSSYGSETELNVIVTSATLDCLPSASHLSPTTPSPTPTATGSFRPQRMGRKRSMSISITDCNDETVRPPTNRPAPPPPGFAAFTHPHSRGRQHPSHSLAPSELQLPLPPLHYLQLARNGPQTPGLASQPPPTPGPTRATKRVRTPTHQAVVLPLKVQREMTVRPGHVLKRGGIPRKMKRETQVQVEGYVYED